MSGPGPDPLEQFTAWLDDAREAGLHEPTAMVLATAGADGRPAARTVLLKGVDARGFVFYTNFESRKGGELAANPSAALVFLWTPLERQVRVEGRVERVAAAKSDAYFASRPRESQIGAWASPQSREIGSREELEALASAAEARFGAGPIPRPPHWGGFVVVPESIEFWQGRPGRLHDRLLYRRAPDGGWSVTRLAP